MRRILPSLVIALAATTAQAAPTTAYVKAACFVYYDELARDTGAPVTVQDKAQELAANIVTHSRTDGTEPDVWAVLKASPRKDRKLIEWARENSDQCIALFKNGTGKPAQYSEWSRGLTAKK